MRTNGAVEPHSGALVTINERDDEGGGRKFYKYQKTNVNNAKVGLLEVNKVVRKYSVQTQLLIKKHKEENFKLKKEKQQQQQITKLEQYTLINPTGSYKKTNNNNSSNNNSTCNKHKKIKTSQNRRRRLIDEICHSKVKENPEKTITTKLTGKASKQAKLSTFKQRLQQSGRLGIGNDFGIGMLISFILTGFTSTTAKIMRVLHVQKSLGGNAARSNETGNGKTMDNVMHCPPQRSLASIVRCLGTLAFFMLLLMPCGLVHGDDGDNFFAVNSFSMQPDTTTPEFDYASRGKKKFGDKCENTLECGFPGSICDPKKKSCQCTEDLPVTNHIDKCGKEAAVNESCFFNEQCEFKYFQTECRDGRCVCRFEMTPIWGKDGSVECKGRQDKRGPETYIDPAMIGVLVGMALMFIIICVVLRLFSQARWRENRTIFNTPNPRLMNVSLLRESKLIHGQERRGSRMSMRGPSRQPSMASLRPHSPNPSLGKTGRMIRSKSNTRSSDSRVSDASNCSRLLEHHSTTHGSTNATASVAGHAHAHAPHHTSSSATHTHSAAITTTYISPTGPASTACSISLNAPPVTVLPIATQTTSNSDKF